MMKFVGNLSVLMVVITISLSSSSVFAFAPPCQGQVKTSSPSTTRLYNIFDDLKLIFSEEGKKNRAAYDERERAEQLAAQKEILDRRRNPNKMREYTDQIATKRQEFQKERDVWNFQRDVVDGIDPLKQWNQLRQEGKIKVGSELERDPASSRLGSEGLVDVRTDERLPYIDQGYVDEDADVMGNFMKLFGGGKKK